MNIVCNSDINYLDKVQVLIKSGLENDSSITFTCRLVNIPETVPVHIDDRVTYMYDNANLDTERRYVVEDWSKKVSSFEPGGMLTFSEAICYYTHIKYDTIQRIMNTTTSPEPILYLDADTIIRKPLHKLNNIPADVGILENVVNRIPWNEQRMVLCTGGLMLFNPTEISKKIIDYCCHNIKYDDIYSDERVFNQACEMFKPNIYDVSTTYKDEGPTFDRASHMWSGHSRAKRIQTYIDECTLYNPSYGQK